MNQIKKITINLVFQMESVVQFLVDWIIAVDRESGQFNRPTADLQDQVVQELGNRR